MSRPVLFLVGLSMVTLLVKPSFSAPCKECPDETSGENQDHHAGKHPVIMIKSVEKTSQRIEVEIASTILVETRWSGEIKERDEESDTDFNSTTYDMPGSISVPLKGESDFTLWEHKRIEDDVFITTAGVAKLDHSLNLDGNGFQLLIIANGRMVYFPIHFIWGPDSLDVSLLPALLQIPPAYVHFEEGEEVQVTWSVRGDFEEASWQFTNYSESDEYSYGGVSNKEGVEVTTEARKDEKTGQNITKTTLSMTKTGLKANHGMYSGAMHDMSFQSYIGINVNVLPKGVMSPVPRGEMVMRAFVRAWDYFGSQSGDVFGVSKDKAAIIQCNAIGYPVDAVTIIRPSLETAYMESTIATGFGYVQMYLQNVQEADTGTYVCVASSYDRVFKKEFEVVLAEPLSVEFEIVSQSSDEVVMRCTAHGHPLPSLTLSTDDENWVSVEIQDGGIYDIQMTSDEEDREVSVVLTVSESIEDYTSFQCKATNDLSERSEWVSVYM